MSFPDVQNLQITGGSFVQTNILGGSIGGLDLLRHNSAPAALLDSNERFDPPRCTEHTRLALIQKVLDWIDNDEDVASMMWLYGAAGAGKSALGQTIAEILKKKGRLAASFFFSRTSTSQRSDGNRLIPTLVLQLLETIPHIRLPVERNINKHEHLFTRSRRTQIDVLFVQPLLSLIPQPIISKPGSRSQRFRQFLKNLSIEARNINSTLHRQPQLQSQLILIDGLDECEDLKVQVDLLRILADSIPKLPFPFRILIASRPETHITQTFDHDRAFQHLQVQRINLGADPNADADIQKYLETGFSEIRRIHRLRAQLGNWPPQRAIETLVQKSSGQFIYASTAMKYIQHSKGRPDQRLEIILNLSVPPTTDKPFAELDALYTYIFDCVDEGDRDTIKCALGILHVAGHRDQNIYYPLATLPAKLEQYLNLQPGDLSLLFEPLTSLVSFSDDPDVEIKILHASLFDYLLDPLRSINHCLDLDLVQQTFARHWLKRMQTFTYDNVQTEPQFDASYILYCWKFVSHCHANRLSSDLLGYLSRFEFLYDVILHPTLLPKALADSAGKLYVPAILQIFFEVLVFQLEDFDNGQHLHSTHVAKVEQQLQSTHPGWDARLHDDSSQDLLFKDDVYQIRHRVYVALSQLFLLYSDSSSLHEILDYRETTAGLLLGEFEPNISTHLLIAFLPHLTVKSFDLCKYYWRCTILFVTNAPPTELGQVLRQQILAYLQHFEADVDSTKVKAFRKAWKLD